MSLFICVWAKASIDAVPGILLFFTCADNINSLPPPVNKWYTRESQLSLKQQTLRTNGKCYSRFSPDQKNVAFVIYTDTLNWKALLKLRNSEVDRQNKNRALI